MADERIGLESDVTGAQGDPAAAARVERLEEEPARLRGVIGYGNDSRQDGP